jgi:hypothetical protein
VHGPLAEALECPKTSIKLPHQRLRSAVALELPVAAGGYDGFRVAAHQIERSSFWPERVTFSRNYFLSVVKIFTPRRPHEIATCHCRALVAALMEESENRT